MYSLRIEPIIHTVYDPNKSVKFEPNYLASVLSRLLVLSHLS